jgi:hypothetical protein
MLVRRRVVAVLGTIDAFQTRIWLTAVKEGILQSETVVWLSDGGRGFWRVFSETFSFYGCGILDFYHASQNLWKAARKWMDGWLLLLDDFYKHFSCQFGVSTLG